MKKFILLILSMALFTSCNSDDENTPSGPDPILGVWFISEVNNPFSNDGELNECNKKSTVEFKEDNNATTIFYDDENGECDFNTTNSVWANIGDSRYEIEIPGFGKQPGKVVFTGTTSFQFNPSNVPGVSIVFKK